MNKKRLSVVMAGAMLATSVAPVLAAEETATTKEYSVGQEALLKKYIEDKFAEKEFTTNKLLTGPNAWMYLGTDIYAKLGSIRAEAARNKFANSAYEVKVVRGKNETVITESNIDAEIVEKALNPGDKIVISEKENATFLGQVIPAKKAPEAVSENTKNVYDKAELQVSSFDADKLKENNRFIKEITCTKDNEATIVLKALTDINNPNSNIKLDIKTGDVKYDLNLPIDKDGNLLDNNSNSTDELQKCNKFIKESVWAGGYVTDASPIKVETINITEGASLVEEVKYNVSDLYDGTLLTEKGTELLNDLKNNTTAKVELKSKNTLNGITTFEVVYKSKKGTPVKKVVVKSSETKDINALYNMLTKKSYTVGIVAGQNRYETAVNVAKEAGVKKLVSSKKLANKGEVANVVLVNGASLVDGLAAAPLSNVKGYSDVAAPLLLTKADSLPKETKDFLNELAEDTAKTDLKEVTINLVGGNSVLSDSLVKELKDMGFSVARFGGDDREETSIKVAKEVGSTSAFVVGANGEADAMSISAEAFTSKTPIIVSSVHGLTADGLEFLGSQSGNATIIGGEKAITEEEEEKIKEAKEDVAGGVKRIAGANRSETNAKILKEFNSKLANGTVTLVKDGSNKKDELVDALSAANLGGPIVLANSKLSDEQMKVLLNGKPATNARLLQVGLGLDNSIIKSLSKSLEIVNK